MGPNGADAWIIFGPLAKMLLDTAHGPKLGAAGPARGTVNVQVNLGPGPVFPGRMRRKGLGSIEPHVALITGVTYVVNEKWVSKGSSLLLLSMATPI